MPSSALGRVLPMARAQLGMDVSMLGTFTGDGEVVCIADGDTARFGIDWGASVDDSLWRTLVEGRGSGVVHDVQALEWGAEILPGSGVRSLVAVPVMLPDGRPLGILSCLSGRARPDLDGRHLRLLRVLGRAIGEALEDRNRASEARLLQVERILRVIGDGLRMVYQPIFDLETGMVAGVEALARFPHDPRRTPRSWFAGARQVGLGIDLEVAAVRAAVAEMNALPPGFVSMNVSAETLVSDEMAAAMVGAQGDRLVLDIVEHERMNDLSSLTRTVARFRRRGVRFAIDNAGAGFASLRHVMRIKPEILKLDQSLTDRIDTDAMVKLVATSLAKFATDAGLMPAAEGIERGPQLEALRGLGVRYGQGYHLARPAPAERLARDLRAAS
jgi:EAL domain-containing protein (putative c-di-GMP-specific phosphodiesterase class I)